MMKAEGILKEKKNIFILSLLPQGILCLLKNDSKPTLHSKLFIKLTDEKERLTWGDYKI